MKVMIGRWKVSIAIVMALALMAMYSSSAMAVVSDIQTQTLTILGAQGAQGDTDPYTEFSLDDGATWSPAYLAGLHGWGHAEGTDNWLNCFSSLDSCVGAERAVPRSVLCSV